MIQVTKQLLKRLYFNPNGFEKTECEGKKIKIMVKFLQMFIKCTFIALAHNSELWSEDKTAWAAPHVCTQESPCL